MDLFALVLVPIFFILAVSGVIVLRPLSKRLGDILELMYEDRQLASRGPVEEVLQRLGAIEERLTRLERENTLGPGTQGGSRGSLPGPHKEELEGP